MEESGTMTVYRCVAPQGLRYTASRSSDLTKCGALSAPTDKGERERVRRKGAGGEGRERVRVRVRVRDGSFCDVTPWPFGCPQPHLADSLIWCALHSTSHPRSA